MENAITRIFGAALENSERNEVAPADIQLDAPALPVQEKKDFEQPRPMASLAQYVMRQFRTNVDHRKTIGPDGTSVEMRLSDALMAQTCRHSGSALEKLRRAGVPSRVYVPITSTKVRAAKAMLLDLINSGGDPLFTMSPSPDPELPSAIQMEAIQKVTGEIQQIFAQLEQSGAQELPPEVFARLQELIRVATIGQYDAIKSEKDSIARKRTKRMETKVWDMMEEGGFKEAFADYIDYICTYGTCVVVGPIMRNVAVNKCIEKVDENGETAHIKEYKRVVRKIPTFEALNPFDCYPSPDAKKVTDGALCVRVKFAANELWRFADGAAEVQDGKKKRPLGEGWNEEAVKALLDCHPSGGVKITEEQRDQNVRTAENNAKDNLDDCTFEGVRCFSTIRGSMLAEMGIVKTRKNTKIKLNSYYYTETIVIDGIVVYCQIFDDAMGLPLSKGVFYELPGSWWGECIADKLIAVQYTMNVCIKSLLQNMGVASGPMYWMNDVSRLNDLSPEGLKMYPHKIWAFNSSLMGNSGAPMGVLQVPSNASELLAVFEKMKSQSDDDSGIPAYTYGQSSGQGALRTASGLAIFSEAANRGMKMIISTTDRLVIADIARRCADWILLYDDDMELKGDVVVRPVGLMGKINRAQQDQQRLSVFQMVVTNPFLTQAIGVKGIFELFRPTVNDLNINADNVIPTEERMKMLEMIAQIKQIFEATAAANGVQENAAAQQGGGVPGVERPEAVKGGVAERRAVA